MITPAAMASKEPQSRLQERSENDRRSGIVYARPPEEQRRPKIGLLIRTFRMTSITEHAEKLTTNQSFAKANFYHRRHWLRSFASVASV